MKAFDSDCPNNVLYIVYSLDGRVVETNQEPMRDANVYMTADLKSVFEKLTSRAVRGGGYVHHFNWPSAADDGAIRPHLAYAEMKDSNVVVVAEPM